MKLFMPESGSDLSIYHQMLSRGAIRPFEMPEGIERLAARVMRLMEIAEEGGRTRDALKAAEILRAFAADNRAIAVEFDKIMRLDAGKPTSISQQLDPEAQARIRRIVSTQRARSNTEAQDDGTRRQDSPGGHEGDDLGRDGNGAEAGGGSDSAGRDRPAKEGA